MSVRERQWMVVAYDVTDNGGRRRLQIALAAYGVAINRSVFRCALDPGELKEIMQVVASEIDPTTDSVVFFPLCRQCEAKTRFFGLPPPAVAEGLAFIG